MTLRISALALGFCWVATALAVSPPGVQDGPATSRNTATSPAVGKLAMISTAHPLATQAGLEILDAGGNAFDAAVAVAATLNVVEPMMSGMGGFGVTLLYDAGKGRARCLDASGRFPAAVDADVFRAPTPNFLLNRKGAKSVSTPGNANAWETLAKEYGKLSWPRLLAPAIKLADDGFIISAHTARHIQSEFDAFPEHARRIYGKSGKPLQAGDRLVQQDLARSLRLLAMQGATAIYGGELGEAIDKTMRDTGGFLRLKDLRRNRAEWWEPVGIEYRGHKVLASPLPNNAWNGLLRLGIMSCFDARKLGHNSPAYLHTFAEATKLAYTARLEFAGDRERNPPPLNRLLSEKHWGVEAARIKPQLALPFSAPARPQQEEEHTTHFVIADRWGNVITSTQTLGMLFGSKVMPPGTGIWLNNSMQYCTFEPKGNPLDALPGRRKLAGFCPMLVLRDGKPWIAVGSPGGHTIVQTVPQIVMNLVDFHMDIQRAIAAPRLSFVEPNITAVDDGVPEEVRKQLSALGHNVRVMRLGNAHGLTIEYDAQGMPERFSGGSDPRGEGSAIGR
jgi:gamma-glutamyltranspeptidase/glutathione hydrolase